MEYLIERGSPAVPIMLNIMLFERFNAMRCLNILLTFRFSSHQGEVRMMAEKRAALIDDTC